MVASESANVPTKTAIGAGGTLQPGGTLTRGAVAMIGVTMGGGSWIAGNSGPITTGPTVVAGGSGAGSVGGAAATEADPHAAISTPMKIDRACLTTPRY